jgi:cysteine-rich repeat protein
MELCGDGKNMGMYDCDDDNNVDGDGCDRNCRIEYGWTCYNGGPNNKDTCVEICGDGLNFLFWQCDDGNINDLDGCNNLCYVEPGWVCTGGTNLTRDVCVE